MNQIKAFKFSDISWTPPKYVLHIFKQIGAPPISQNSWGAKSASVSTKDTRDAYDKNNHFISKVKEIWFY